MQRAKASVPAYILAIAASASNAAIVTPLADKSLQHTPTATVTFDNMTANGFTYTEAGVTIRRSDSVTLGRFTFTNSYPSDYGLGSLDVVSYTFPSPTYEVGWDESVSSSPSVRLFSDAAGAQLIGTFPIAITYSVNAPRFHGFVSDTPFRRMMFSGSVPTHIINNMQYTPEPTVLLSACGASILVSLSRVIRRHRRL